MTARHDKATSDFCVCGHERGSDNCCNFKGAEYGLCLQCGRPLTTEESIRSDFCPECDPPRRAVRP